MTETIEMKKVRLLREFSPMAKRMAFAFRRKLPPTVDTDDLVAAALAGLWDAVRFHPEAAAGFEHYAAMRVRGSILDELRTQDWLPRRYRTKVTEGKALAVRFYFDEDATERLVETDDLEDDLSKRLMGEKLVQYLDLLMPRERQIVVAHYFRGHRFLDIGKNMGISEPRVSQIHSRAMRKLRERVPKSFLSVL